MRVKDAYRIEPIGIIRMNRRSFTIEIVEQLPENAFVIDNTKEGFFSFLNYPLEIEIYLSNVCNFSCFYCFIEKGREVMSRDIVESTFKFARKYGVYIISILGGEPLHPLTFPLLEYIVRKYSEDFYLNLTTNAYFIDNRRIKILKGLENNEGVLNVTFLGGKEEYYRIAGLKTNKVIENIEKIDEKLRYALLIPILPQNYRWLLNNLRDFIESLDNISAVVFRQITPKNMKVRGKIFENKQFFKRLSVILEKIRDIEIRISFDVPFAFSYFKVNPPRNILDLLYSRCGGGVRWISVFWDGSVYPCSLSFGMKEYFMGNILKEDIKMRRICERAIPQCLDCKYYLGCTGCPLYVKLLGIEVDDRCPLRK